MNAFACTLAISAGIAFSGPPPTHERVETIMQDDAALLYRPRTQVRRSLRRMARLGVDWVRVTASWRQLAPARDSRKRPRFDATDSSAYDHDALRRLDDVVRGARREGMQVMLDLGFFAPRWAVQRGAPGGRNVWRPSVPEYARYSRAFARRYGGDFDDPARPARKLPAVKLWTTWNEPNNWVFLQPQSEHGHGVSPGLYRRLHNAAYDQLKAVSKHNRVLIGGLASYGARTPGPRHLTPPLRFTRELACVDAQLRPVRDGDCRGFEPLRADGFSMHPYSNDTPPTASDPGADRVQVGELGKLSSLLAELHKRGRLARPLPLYITEYGYDTDPPDPGGIPPALQARYAGSSLLLAWRNAQVRSFAHFLLDDMGPLTSEPAGSAARWLGHQSGLYSSGGRAKPVAIRSFTLPFMAEALRGSDGRAAVVTFGQVRPGRGSQAVRLQQGGPHRRWRTVACLGTDGQGIYRRVLPFSGPGSYRAVWLGPTGPRASAGIDVGAPAQFDGPAARALARVR